MSYNKETFNNGEFKKTEDLLKNLSLEISKKFGIDKELTKRLIESKTKYDLDGLKKELEKIDDKSFDISENKLEELLYTIKGAKEIIFQNSQERVSLLKADLEKEGLDLVRIGEKRINKMLPKNLILKARDANNIHEHVLGLALGSAETFLTVVDALYNVGKGILKTPYDIYLIVSGKGEYNGIKNI